MSLHFGSEWCRNFNSAQAFSEYTFLILRLWLGRALLVVSISRADFLRSYVLLNRPVLVRIPNIVYNKNVLKQWFKADAACPEFHLLSCTNKTVNTRYVYQVLEVVFSYYYKQTEQRLENISFIPLKIGQLNIEIETKIEITSFRQDHRENEDCLLGGMRLQDLAGTAVPGGNLHHWCERKYLALKA